MGDSPRRSRRYVPPVTRGARGSAVLLLVALAVAGCGVVPEPGSASPVPGATPGEASGSATATSSGSAATSSASPSAPTSTPTPTATAATGGGALIPLAIEQRHPNGSVLRLRGVALAPTSISVQVEVVNGLDRLIRLAYTVGNRELRLEDDRGSSYQFVPPPDNELLQIEPRGTLSGTLVFYGVPDPAATALRIQFNGPRNGPLSNAANTTESATEAIPTFSATIPLR